jgi:hypothetical protein
MGLGTIMGLTRILAIASFLLYAIAATVAIRQKPSIWAAEYNTVLPAAISNVVYGLQLGLMDSNVVAEFEDTFRVEGLNPGSLEKAVNKAAQGDIPHGVPLPPSEGIGMGQTLFSATAMRLFGPHLSSLGYGFLLLMGVSVLAFVGRFKGALLAFVPLQFAALTCMLLTPLITNQDVLDEAPIGGNRFFGIAAILPALHIFFEFADGAKPERGARKNWIFLGVQLFIFVLVLLVRSSNAYMLAPLVCVGLFSTLRDDRAERLRIYLKCGLAYLLGVVFLSIMIASAPYYLSTGRIGGIIWHRAFISFSIHPEWPFGNLRDVYQCEKYIPEGLQRTGNADRNGHCVWMAYPPNQTRPIHEVQEKTYGPEYEGVLRRAVFSVIFSYPRQALELYLYYKPIIVATTLRAALDWKLYSVPPPILFFAVLQVAVFVWFYVVSATTTPFKASTMFGVIALFFLFSLAPQLVAWASLWTSPDLIFYMYAAFLIVAALIVQTSTLLICRTWVRKMC